MIKIKGVQKMNDNNLEFQIAYSKIIKLSWIIIIAVASIITILGTVAYLSDWAINDQDYTWYKWPLSYILGAMVNLFAFNLLKININTLSSDNKSGGISASFSNYVIRFAIYGFIFYIAFTSRNLNPYFVAGGFLTVRIAIYLYSFLNKNK
jgi:hypothetical protein